MMKRLMEVFAAAAAVVAFAGAVQAKTTPSSVSAAQPVAPASAAARRLAQPIFVDPRSRTPAADFAAPAARAHAQARFVAPLRLRSAFDPAQLAAATSPSFGARAPATLEAAQAEPSAARFAAAFSPSVAPSSAAPDWGAFDAAYRGGPISTYGADAPVGVGLRIRF